ncbi:MAG: ribulose-phosphate 3-epimerase [Puniceicoccales bacterium]|jgi:ribulose-phosphate 3-epimerase|nr:ribulose-phosphate 3-epimerase [Puniceicoccales bacterium]
MIHWPSLKKFPKKLLVPSLLGGDHGNLLSSLKLIESYQLPWVHVDIMDGHFVPNLSFGPQTIAALKQHSFLFFDVHLMLEHPETLVPYFIKVGVDLISFHIESQAPIASTLQYIHDQYCAVGLACNPDTPEEQLVPWLRQVDLILFMTVQPGFCGQAFLNNVLPKIARIATVRQKGNSSFRIAVDGGIDAVSAEKCLAAGADIIISGTSFFDPVKRDPLQQLLS